MTPKRLFLDFDCVLHPDAAYLTSRGDAELHAAGELFMWPPYLVEALAPSQGAHIVLPTSWARNLGFHHARSVLPAELQTRVIGATWHSAMGRGDRTSSRGTWNLALSRSSRICLGSVRRPAGSRSMKTFEAGLTPTPTG